MRPAVRDVLLAIWEKRDRPDTGPVFLNKLGKPYADTRQTGGNPFASAHRTACRKAGIDGVPHPRLAPPLRRLVPQARR